MYPLARLLFVPVGLWLVLFGFGWSFLSRYTTLDKDERLAAAPLPGMLVVATTQLVVFLLGVSPVVPNAVIFSALLIAAVWGFTSRKETREDLRALGWQTGGLCLVAMAQLVCIQCVLPIYVGGNWYDDWAMHYDISLVFGGHLSPGVTWGPYSIASRNPLFNLLAAAAMSLGGHDFFVFQLAAVVLNACFVPAVFLVARDLSTPLGARTKMLLVTLNFWMLHNAWYTWPKMLALYFALLGLHFYLRFARGRSEGRPSPRYFAWFVTSFLLAFLCHQVMAIYFAVLLLHAVMIRDTARRLSAKDVVLGAAPVLVLLAGWYGWLLGHFGLGRMLAASPTSIMNASAEPGSGFFRSIVEILLNSTISPPIWQGLVGGPYRAADLYKLVTMLYMGLVPGAVTLSLCAAGLFGWWRARRHRWLRRVSPPERSAILVLLIFGTLSSVALHPTTPVTGCAHSVFFPTTVVVALLAWGAIDYLPPRWAKAAVIGAVLEFFIIFWSHVYVANTSAAQSSSGNWILKEEHRLVFAADVLGNARWSLAVLAASLQLVLAVRLLRLVLGKPSRALSPAPDEQGWIPIPDEL